MTGDPEIPAPGLAARPEVPVLTFLGGAGTVTGAILGSAFVVLLPRLVGDFTQWLQSVALGDGFGSAIANVFVATTPNDFGFNGGRPSPTI